MWIQGDGGGVIHAEMVRQLRRVWTWVGFAALAAIPILITFASRNERRRRFQFNLFTLLSESGFNSAAVGLVVMSQFFLVVVAALFAGAAIAGEASQGTLRYLLIRPVSRVRVVLAKLAVTATLVSAATLTVTVAGLAAGAVFFGWKEPSLPLRPLRFPFVAQISIPEAVGRLALATGYVSLTMMVVVALGLFLSTLADTAAGPVVATIGLFVTSQILDGIPSLEFMRPVLPTHYWQSWTTLFLVGRGSEDMWKGIASAVAYGTVLVLLALWRFQRKDILS
jgi:ABC-2 type transport system permease protein